MDNMSKLSCEQIHKEIDLIQSCITRMANNSFMLKGWLVSLIVVILALSPSDNNMFIPIISITLITISFWYLDAFFLRTEKLYRKLYNWVLEERPKNNTFLLYDLNPHRFNSEVEGIYVVMFSKTLRWFYSLPIVIIVIITIYYLSPILSKIICKCN